MPRTKVEYAVDNDMAYLLFPDLFLTVPDDPFSAQMIARERILTRE